MIINKIILFSIVASIVACDRISTDTIGHNLTLDQFEGLWFDIGKISACDDDARSCSTYKITRDDGSEQQFLYNHISIESIHNCDHGVPIVSHSVYGKLVNSTMDIKGDNYYPRLLSAVNSYNNGEELIFSDTENGECTTPSYRLWSRKRQVSAETRAEFEKLAGTIATKYYSWNYCPKMRCETGDEFTLEQFKGPWYGIAKIYYGDLDNNTCIFNNVTVDHEKKTFGVATTVIVDGFRAGDLYDGEIVGPFVNIREVRGDNRTGEIMTALPISCNIGTELLWLYPKSRSYELLSRLPQVAEASMTEFKRLARNFPDSHFTIYPRDDCPY